jgi:hypothetical protein
MNVAFPCNRTAFELTGLSKIRVLTAALPNIVASNTLSVGSCDPTVHQEVSFHAITFNAVALKVAYTAIVFWATLVRAVLPVPQVIALAHADECVAISVPIALQLPDS